MSRCIAAALLSAMLLAVVPAAAAAQAPSPGERAAAHAFAAITLPAARAIEATDRTFAFDAPRRCKAERRLGQANARQRSRFGDFLEIHGIASYTRAIAPTLAATVAALDGVQTADPILQDGRASWHSVQRTYARIGTLSRVRICPVLRDYVRAGYKPTPAMRRAARMHRFAMRWDTTEIERAQAQAIVRMIALGVAPAQADGFDGELESAS
jgi:hypothetical protein